MQQITVPFTFNEWVKQMHRRGTQLGWWDLFREGRIWVAWSGGADSTLLLHLLLALQKQESFSLGIAHFDHGLRKESEEEAELLSRWASAHNIPFCLGRWKDQGIPVWSETEARRARYQFFASLRSSQDWIALGHHSQDQMETFFLNLIRGTGLKGLTGMAPIQKPWFRPLLQEDPTQFPTWLKESSIPWLEDESNLDTRILRNALRHRLLPLLQSLGGSHMEKHFLQAMDNLRDWRVWIEAEAGKILHQIQFEWGLDSPRFAAYLPRSALLSLSAPMLQEVLVCQLCQLETHANIDWSRIQYQRLEPFVRDPSGPQKHLQFPGHWSLWKKGAWLGWFQKGTPPDWSLVLELNSQIAYNEKVCTQPLEVGLKRNAQSENGL